MRQYSQQPRALNPPRPATLAFAGRKDRKELIQLRVFFPFAAFAIFCEIPLGKLDKWGNLDKWGTLPRISHSLVRSSISMQTINTNVENGNKPQTETQALADAPAQSTAT